MMMDRTKRERFSVYPDKDGPFVVLEDEDPELPLHARGVAQNVVDDAVEQGTLEVDEPLNFVGWIEYLPGKNEGDVTRVCVREDLTMPHTREQNSGVDDLTVDIQYERDRTVDEIREDQWYWNSYDGELFLVQDDLPGNQIQIVKMDGSTEIVPQEDMVFRSDEIGEAIHPVKFSSVHSEWPA